MFSNVVSCCIHVRFSSVSGKGLSFVSCYSESAVIDKDEKSLTKPFVEYIDGARLYLEGESDRDLPTLQDIRLHFSRFVRHLICNTSGMQHTLINHSLFSSLSINAVCLSVHIFLQLTTPKPIDQFKKIKSQEGSLGGPLSKLFKELIYYKILVAAASERF